MMLPKKLSVLGMLIIIMMIVPYQALADVMMTGSITSFGMDVTPSASFTTDDWLNREGMFSITIINGDTKTVKKAEVVIEITHGGYGTVLTGLMNVVDADNPNEAFKSELTPGQAYTINNTMIRQESPQMSGGNWSEDFKDEVIRTGSLPEGRYTMKFTLQGYYGSPSDPIESGHEINKSMDIKNPTPPELITPDDLSDNVVTIPRFVWQRPLVSNLSDINKRMIQVYYTIKVWRMFGNDGSVISEEDAIQRIPIWTVANLTNNSVDFKPGDAWEELIPGRKYCWQVQAVDGTGRPISPTNEGKSDVWQFTCQFTPPVLNQPYGFYPFQCTWSPARAGGGLVYYRMRIADNADMTGAYERTGIVMTRFRYPDDAPQMRLGVIYFIELQTTDDSGIPIGMPVTDTFSLPISEITLRSPADGSTSSSMTPRFEWSGTAPNYIVMIYDEQGDWNYISGPVQTKSWDYDGEDLQPGKTYAWSVSAATDAGDPVGESSGTWYFSLPGQNQVSLVSPVSETIMTLFPTFTWQAIQAPSEQATIEYTIVIMDANGGTVNSAQVAGTSYQYPQDAPMLKYASKYSWNVTARMNNTDVGTPSQTATFTTPMSGSDQQIATVEEVGEMLKTVLGNFPEFDAFKEKVLISIADENGPMTPSAFIELFNTFQIVNVSSK